MRRLNYFDHHIGDYDEATSHLTAREDGIYHRLIRKYYAKERPLPADVEQIQRLARCRDDEDRQAVVDVLAEFFVLREDGYHQKTCDEVIAAYQAGEPSREAQRAAKQAHEDDRKHRHNLERSRLFEVVRGAGLHAPWNIGMASLRAMAARASTANPPRTAPGTAPGTAPRTTSDAPGTAPGTASDAPGTATQSHTHSPIEETVTTTAAKSPPPDGAGNDDKQPVKTTTKAERGARLPKDWVLPRSWGEWALAKYPHWTVEIVRDIALSFRNHWSAKTGKDATKLDWERTWQNWCMSVITQKQYPPPRAGAQAPLSFRERDAEAAAQRIARLTGGMANAALLTDPPQETLDADAIEVHARRLA